MTTPHATWCRQLFASLKDGGTWGVPRSGLIFTKRGNTFILTTIMPHHPLMPITPEQLREQQDDEYDQIKSHFEAAGIQVIRD